MPELFSLDGGVVAVTGAAGGIGAALALGIAQHGAKVGCIDRPGADLAATVSAVEGAGGTALAVEADVSDGDSIAAAVTSVQHTLGAMTGAVNCAGINNQMPSRTMDRHTWQELIDINLTGVFLSCQAEGAALIDNGGGSIVNIGSISAIIANRGLAQAHYNSAKAGVLHLSTSLALEWAPDNVRVNVVSPGYTATPMAKHPDVWPHVQAYIKDIPMNRMAEPDELVGPVVFLLSRASSYCTGINVQADGGAAAW